MRFSRGVLLGGAAAVAAAVAGGGGWAGAQDGLALLQAEALVAALEARLPAGSDVSYGGIEARPLGSALLRDVAVRVGPEGAPRERVTAAEVELAGDPQAWAQGRIGTLRARGVAARDPGARRASAEALELRDLALAALPALAEGRLPEAGAGLGSFAAETVEIVEGADRLALARAAFEGLDADRLRGLTLEGLDGTTPAYGRTAIGRVRLGALEWAGVDWPAAVAASERLRAARGGDRGAPQGRAPRDATAFAFAGLDLLVALAGGRVSGLELEGLAVDPSGPRPVATRLARLAVGELSAARLGPVELAELDAGDAELKLRAGGMRYDATIEAFPLAELRSAAATLPRTAEGAARVREILAGVAGRYTAGVGGLVIDDARSGVRAGFGSLDASGATGPEREENRVAVGALALDLAGAGGAPNPALARAARVLGNVTGGLVAAWSADRAARAVSLDQLGLDLDGLGALDASASGLAPERPASGVPLAPGLGAAGTSLARARVVYTDRSLVGRLLAAWGEPSGLPPDMVADAFAGMLTNPGAVPWLDAPSREALAGFLRRPGRLEIELAPSAPLPAQAILGLAARSPTALAPALGLRVTATPP